MVLDPQGIIDKFGPDPKIAIVCRGGPENGPFSAMAARIITEVLGQYNLKVTGVYSCSGSVSTSLLGCTGDYAKLCNIWLNITPKKIIGKVGLPRTLYRVMRRKESFFTSDALRHELEKNLDMAKFTSPEAILAKFPAVDALASKQVIFSNKNPKHIPWVLECALGSMALIPFLPPQVVREPEDSMLIEKGESRTIEADSRIKIMPVEEKPYKAALLIDGGYMGNMLLEEAQRDGFNVIFLVDIHGLVPTDTDLTMKRNWPNLTRIAQHILSNINDKRQYQHSERINEEIAIKERLIELTKKLEPSQAEEAEAIIEQMNWGRLRLVDKEKTQIYTISDPERSILFNFTNFKPDEVVDLMTIAWNAAIKTLQELGLDTRCAMPIRMPKT